MKCCARPTVKTFALVGLLVTLVSFALTLYSRDVKWKDFRSLQDSRFEIGYEMMANNSTILEERSSGNDDVNAVGDGEMLPGYVCDTEPPIAAIEEPQPVYLHSAEREEQAGRRALLEKVCKEERARNGKLERRHFLLDRSRRLFYCWIHKAASSSWIAFMTSLRGRRVRPKKIYREINRLAAESAEEVKSSARDFRVRLIVVRHPFRRLISAYRDRIWAATTKFSAQAWTYVPRILRLTRPSLHQSLASILRNRNRTLIIVPTFEEFVRYLLNTANVNHEKTVMLEEPLDVTQRLMDIHPNVSAFDVHWVPYYKHCSICSIPYNIIIKLETIKNDKEYFMDEMDLDISKENSTTGKAGLPNVPVYKHDEKNVTKTNMNNISRNVGEQESDRITVGGGIKVNNPNQCLDYQDNKRGQVSSTIRDVNLHHLQVSKIGPSCPCYYFSQLSKDQINGLKKIYEIDLKMFSYSTEEFENCAKR